MLKEAVAIVYPSVITLRNIPTAIHIRKETKMQLTAVLATLILGNGLVAALPAPKSDGKLF